MTGQRGQETTSGARTAGARTAGARTAALAYGLLATRRRARGLLLPAVTVATGAFLLVMVVALLPAVRRQGAAFGAGADVGRAAIVISVLVVLVGALEVAIAATRSIVARTREIGVLSGFGVPARSIVYGLMVEPVLTAAAGATAGALLGAAAAPLIAALGWADAAVSAGWLAAAVPVAIVTATVSAALAGAAPAVRAARRPPLISLTS